MIADALKNHPQFVLYEDMLSRGVNPQNVYRILKAVLKSLRSLNLGSERETFLARHETYMHRFEERFKNHGLDIEVVEIPRLSRKQ